MFQIALLLLSPSYSEEIGKYPESNADISSINDLAYKTPVTLDPKIRKALLNVLNRLEEEEEESQTAGKREPINQQIYRTQAHNASASSLDNVKWEYKKNNTFHEYNFYETATDDNKRPELTISEDKVINEEPGALFFQIPENQDTALQQESLNLQESKNSLIGSDILYANLQNEINKHNDDEHHEPPKNGFNVTQKKQTPIVSEKDVEVFQAPLLTAFTLEQDERGLPRRIIPLESSELRSMLDNKVNYQPEDNQRVTEQQAIGEQERIQGPPIFRDQQRFPVPYSIYRNEIGNGGQVYEDEQKRFHQELEAQYHQLQERKRQFELEKERLFTEQEKSKRLKLALEQRRKEQDYLRIVNQNEIIKPEIAFQKSGEQPLSFNIYDKQPVILPQFTRPLPTRQIPQNYVYPDMVDRQLQNLLSQSGLNQGKQEDLNIVSKILALNHEGEEERSNVLLEKSKERENEFQYGDSQNNKRIISEKQPQFRGHNYN